MLQEGASTGLTPTASFLLHCHEDILRVPHNKVYVVCVDFNERNVILEDPTKGLGDIRLTTVQALHKMGGKLADGFLAVSVCWLFSCLLRFVPASAPRLV